MHGLFSVLSMAVRPYTITHNVQQEHEQLRPACTHHTLSVCRVAHGDATREAKLLFDVEWAQPGVSSLDFDENEMMHAKKRWPRSP